jgi:hypothetical protein
MNSYFFKINNEERSNILDQHKEIYDGYVTSYAQQPKEQPLYTQSYANDKGGLTVNNRGEVTTYRNTNINEMHADGKSTGLFSDEEEEYNEGYISAGVEYAPEETFEGLEDMIGDGPTDLEHGTFEDDDSDMVLVSPEFEDDLEGDDLVFGSDSEIFNDIDSDEVEGLFDDLKESLDMFKRFTKYN